jgi:hypothetical protein
MASSTQAPRRARTGSRKLSCDFVIDSRPALAAFRRGLLRPSLPAVGRISVDPAFAPDIDAVAEDRLNRRYSDCGCTAASMALALASLAGAIRSMRADQPFDMANARRSIAEIIAAGLVGKAAGLITNRLILLRMTENLMERSSLNEDARGAGR